jgi:radical SAM protein with 4Fe4S-binding SPASM domain
MLRSRVPFSAIVKTSLKVLSKPRYLRQIVSLQISKQLFSLFHRHPEKGHAGKIRQLSFRITDFCNLRCHTCGQWGDNGYLRDKDWGSMKREEVKLDRYMELLEDLKAHGHLPILYFWGGEPMLYPGIVELIEAGARLRMPPTIATNGTKITENAERLVKAPMFLIQISVDGATAEIHNAARPGSISSYNNFNVVTEAFETLSKVKKQHKQSLPLVVSLTTISRENYRNLVDIYEKFKDVTDMQIFYLSWWIDEARAEAYVEDSERRFEFKPNLPFAWIGEWHKFDYQALSEQLEELQRRSAKMSGTPVYIMPPLYKAEDLQTYYTDHSERFGFDQCISIFHAPELDSNGNLSPCRDYHDYIVGNIKEQTITELWNSPKYVRFRQSLSKDGLMPVCSRCCGLMGY